MKKTMGIAVLGLMATAGCYSTWDVPAKSLESLNGFHEPERRPLVDVAGEELTFDHSTELRFTEPGGEPIGAKFSSISIAGPEFSGATRPFGQPLTVDLRQVVGVSAKKFSTVKTVLAIAIPVGVLTILSVVVAAVALSHGSTDYCDPYYGC